MPPIPMKVLIQRRIDRLGKSSKVKHVLKATQDREHHCHWPDCNKQVPPAMWGCRSHWMKLPKHLRDRIWLSYRIGQEEDFSPSMEYLSVARAVQDWIKVHHPNG
jgi:hypothetical protein